jgi:hypothetical protein
VEFSELPIDFAHPMYIIFNVDAHFSLLSGKTAFVLLCPLNITSFASVYNLVCSTLALKVPGRPEMLTGYIRLSDFKSIEN